MALLYCSGPKCRIFAALLISAMLLLLNSCSSRNVSQDEARQLAFDEVHKPKLYKDLKYDPDLLPKPRESFSNEYYLFDFRDSLQDVELLIAVHQRGTIERSARRDYREYLAWSHRHLDSLLRQRDSIQLDECQRSEHDSTTEDVR